MSKDTSYYPQAQYKIDCRQRNLHPVGSENKLETEKQNNLKSRRIPLFLEDTKSLCYSFPGGSYFSSPGTEASRVDKKTEPQVSLLSN